MKLATRIFLYHKHGWWRSGKLEFCDVPFRRLFQGIPATVRRVEIEVHDRPGKERLELQRRAYGSVMWGVTEVWHETLLDTVQAFLSHLSGHPNRVYLEVYYDE